MKKPKKIKMILFTIISLLIIAIIFPNQETVLSHTILIKSNKDRVYKILADIGKVDQWAKPVHQSKCISENKTGIGALRECKLEDGSVVQEEITNAIENEFIEMEMVKHNLPVDYFKWKIELNDNSNGNETVVTQTTKYSVKYGLFGVLMNKIMVQKSLDKTFIGVYQNLKDYVENDG